MAEAQTIARPYANAAFAYAKEHGEIQAWSDWLAVMAVCVADADMQAVITSPKITDDQVVSLLVEIAGQTMTESTRNFVALLAENNRLVLLDEIAVLFEALRAEDEKAITAQVATAMPLSADQEARMIAALTARLGKVVTLEVQIDHSLIGGAIVRAGDLVIDGSALGKLNRLASALS